MNIGKETDLCTKTASLRTFNLLKVHQLDSNKKPKTKTWVFRQNQSALLGNHYETQNLPLAPP